MKMFRNAFSRISRKGRKAERKKCENEVSPKATRPTPEEITPIENQRSYSSMSEFDDSSNGGVKEPESCAGDTVGKRMVIYNNPEEVGCSN